jgi:arylsulfatase A-like enzyme
MKVIMLLIDTMRFDFLGFNGNSWIETPNIDRLAGQSTAFDRAYIGSYPCMPARRDILTGQFEFPFRGWGPLEYDDVDLPQVLSKENNITSMLVTDHFHLWETGSGNYHFNFSGYEFIRGQEYDQWCVWPGGESNQLGPKQADHLADGYFEQNRRNVSVRQCEEDYAPAQVMIRAADWIEKNRDRENFFLMIDSFDPHEPFDPPQHYIDRYSPNFEGDEVIWPTYGWNQMSLEETEHVRALYAAELTMTDRWVGHLLNKLEELELMDDTMIILTTDHGFMLGEHGTIGKPWAAISDSDMYEEICHIPLVIYHPHAQTRGTHVDHLVQPVDLYATVLDAFGIERPGGLHGTSLLPVVIDGKAPAAVRSGACFGRFGESINVTDGEWTLFLWPPGDKNEPLWWHSQVPPEFGPYQTTGPKQSGFPHDRFPVACARGEMTTRLFNVVSDPGQLHDRSADEPEIVERLKGLVADFLVSIGAPDEQFERLGLEMPAPSGASGR